MDCLSVCDPVVDAVQSSGFLANIVTEEQSFGSSRCPWVITAPRGQRLNVTLVDFGLAQRQETIGASPGLGSGATGPVDGLRSHGVPGLTRCPWAPTVSLDSHGVSGPVDGLSSHGVPGLPRCPWTHTMSPDSQGVPGPVDGLSSHGVPGLPRCPWAHTVSLDSHGVPGLTRCPWTPTVSLDSHDVPGLTGCPWTS